MHRLTAHLEEQLGRVRKANSKAERLLKPFKICFQDRQGFLSRSGNAGIARLDPGWLCPRGITMAHHCHHLPSGVLLRAGHAAHGVLPPF